MAQTKSRQTRSAVATGRWWLNASAISLQVTTTLTETLAKSGRARSTVSHQRPIKRTTHPRDRQSQCGSSQWEPSTGRSPPLPVLRQGQKWCRRGQEWQWAKVVTHTTMEPPQLARSRQRQCQAGQTGPKLNQWTRSSARTPRRRWNCRKVFLSPHHEEKEPLVSSHCLLLAKSTKTRRLEGGAAKCGSTAPCSPEGRRSGAVGKKKKKKKGLLPCLKIEIVLLQHGK